MAMKKKTGPFGIIVSLLLLLMIFFYLFQDDTSTNNLSNKIPKYKVNVGKVAYNVNNGVEIGIIKDVTIKEYMNVKKVAYIMEDADGRTYTLPTDIVTTKKTP